MWATTGTWSTLVPLRALTRTLARVQTPAPDSRCSGSPRHWGDQPTGGCPPSWRSVWWRHPVLRLSTLTGPVCRPPTPCMSLNKERLCLPTINLQDLTESKIDIEVSFHGKQPNVLFSDLLLMPSPRSDSCGVTAPRPATWRRSTLGPVTVTRMSSHTESVLKSVYIIILVKKDEARIISAFCNFGWILPLLFLTILVCMQAWPPHYRILIAKANISYSSQICIGHVSSVIHHFIRFHF